METQGSVQTSRLETAVLKGLGSQRLVALFAGGWAIGQLWMFWVAPILGAVIGALIWKAVGEPE